MDYAFKIGKAEIRHGGRAFVIAEAGVNHNGDLATAFTMVEAAAACGADAVKFQAFSAERLVTGGAPGAAYQGQASQRDMLSRLELMEEDFVALAAHCAGAGILMLVTPFSPPDVDMMVQLGAQAVKIASPDVVNTPLLRAIGRTGLPAILSTGAAELDEVAAAIDTLRDAGCGALALMHCVSSYPTAMADANLSCVRTLHERFGLPTGFSDHTTETVTGELAVGMGACILEKHFTLDPEMSGPDHGFSLRPVELAAYIARVRRATPGQLDRGRFEPHELAALGDGVKAASAVEQDVRRVARSSVTSVVAIPAGTTLTAAMLTVKRPGGGIPPAELDGLVGRAAAVDIPADATLTRDMIA